MSTAPDTPSTPPHMLPAKRGERWTKKPSQNSRKRTTRPLTMIRWRSFMLRLHAYVVGGLRLAGENDPLLFVTWFKSLFDGHCHLAGQQLHAARAARAHATRVVNL